MTVWAPTTSKLNTTVAERFSEVAPEAAAVVFVVGERTADATAYAAQPVTDTFDVAFQVSPTESGAFARVTAGANVAFSDSPTHPRVTAAVVVYRRVVDPFGFDVYVGQS